jgi:hypothetical protein
VKDRIDDWWIQSPPQDSGKRALVEGYEGTLKLAEAPREVLGLHDEMGEVFLDKADDIIDGTKNHGNVSPRTRLSG